MYGVNGLDRAEAFIAGPLDGEFQLPVAITYIY